MEAPRSVLPAGCAVWQEVASVVSGRRVRTCGKLTVNDMGPEPGVVMILGAKCDSARYMNKLDGMYG